MAAAADAYVNSGLSRQARQVEEMMEPVPMQRRLVQSQYKQ